MSIIDKMRKARESTFKVGSVTLTVRRPTDWDALGMQYTSTKDAIVGISEFIVDWSGVSEIDLMPGGTNKPVAFELEIFQEWLKDNPDHWSDIIDKVQAVYKQHVQKTEETVKNLKSG